MYTYEMMNMLLEYPIYMLFLHILYAYKVYAYTHIYMLYTYMYIYDLF